MSNQMAQLQEATIKAHCKTLRMPMIASQFGYAGRTSHPGKEEPHRVSGGVAAGRGGRTRTEHYRTPNPGACWMSQRHL